MIIRVRSPEKAFPSTYTTPVSPQVVSVLVSVWRVLVEEIVVHKVKVPKFLAVEGRSVMTTVLLYVAVLVGTITCLVVVEQSSCGKAFPRLATSSGSKAKNSMAVETFCGTSVSEAR